MHELSQMIKDDMKPALGVTEPGAIAFAVAKARSFTKGDIKKVNVAMNSGMYKNAFTCGIPNSNEVGNVFAAALGVVAGNADKGLESLADVTPEDNVKAQEMIDQGKVTVELSGITSRIFIEATVETEEDKAIVTIRDSHTNITKITVNDKVELETEDEKKTEEDGGEEEAHSSITGMICDGGNQGCTMKGVAAVDAAYKSVEFAMNGIYISEVHGINGNTPEETMRNMGLIASPGMVGTEKTIVEIFEDKLKK